MRKVIEKGNWYDTLTFFSSQVCLICWVFPAPCFISNCFLYPLFAPLCFKFVYWILNSHILFCLFIIRFPPSLLITPLNLSVRILVQVLLRYNSTILYRSNTLSQPDSVLKNQKLSLLHYVTIFEIIDHSNWDHFLVLISWHLVMYISGFIFCHSTWPLAFQTPF